MLLDLAEARQKLNFQDRSPHAFAVATATGVAKTILAFTVPDGKGGILRAWGYDSPAATHATLVLKLLLNGSPIGSYPAGISGILGGMRAAELEEVFQPLRGGDKLELVATQTSGAASTADARFKIALWDEPMMVQGMGT